ncbi:MAG: YceI family protein [Ferruginibacter sp.]
MLTKIYRPIKGLVITTVILLTLMGSGTAQKYYTKNGNISFFSKTNLENISADNNQVVSVLNTQTGELQFSLIVKNFHFKKALMEEHFNENYLESDKFPKATFKGNISDIAKVNFSAYGSYAVTVTGDLTIHGITKKVSSSGTVTVKSGKINATSKFIAKPSDYNIAIPKLVKDNIAETIEVTVNCDYDQKM